MVCALLISGKKKKKKVLVLRQTAVKWVNIAPPLNENSPLKTSTRKMF